MKFNTFHTVDKIAVFFMIYVTLIILNLNYNTSNINYLLKNWSEKV